MNPVMTLAERVCPHCSGTGSGGANYDCSTCNGTGALVPGLRKTCHSYEGWQVWCGGTIQEGRCLDCRRLIKVSRHKGFTERHREVCICQGRTWNLIPQAEQMGVLVRYALEKERHIEIESFDNGYIRIKFSGPILAYKLTPEEAVAQALLQGG